MIKKIKEKVQFKRWINNLIRPLIKKEVKIIIDTEFAVLYQKVHDNVYNKLANHFEKEMKKAKKKTVTKKKTMTKKKVVAKKKAGKSKKK